MSPFLGEKMATRGYCGEGFKNTTARRACQPSVRGRQGAIKHGCGEEQQRLGKVALPGVKTRREQIASTPNTSSVLKEG